MNEKRQICHQIIASFFNHFTIAHCAVAFTFPPDIMMRNFTWKTLEQKKTFCIEHGFPYDSKTLTTPILFNDTAELLKFLNTRNPMSMHAGMIYPDRNTRKYEETHELLRGPVRLDLDIPGKERAQQVNCPCGELQKCCLVCWNQWLKPRLRKILDFVRNKLGWKRILLVFSGRRGVHVWIMDELAQDTTMAQRAQLIAHLEAMGITMDGPVTYSAYHLCKVPGLLHAETKCICALIPLSHWEDFNPESSPTLEKATLEQLRMYLEIVEKC
jgi:DNA primase catalytic subunit